LQKTQQANYREILGSSGQPPKNPADGFFFAQTLDIPPKKYRLIFPDPYTFPTDAAFSDLPEG